MTIPIAFHIIRYTNGSGDVEDDKLYSQLNVLNSGFNTSLFRFVLYKIDRTSNNDWAQCVISSMNERNMKAQLSIDPKNVLNVYICQTIRNPPPDESVYGGFSYLPDEFTNENDAVMHGVVIARGTMPGETEYPNRTLGKTLIHETGHYLGLFHTFRGGCIGEGDEVADTPALAGPTSVSDCPENNNTCPSPGLDPVHNYMDYSTDYCLTQFTNGQLNRMYEKVEEYRPEILNSKLIVTQRREDGTELNGTTFHVWNNTNSTNTPYTVPAPLIPFVNGENVIISATQQLVESNNKYYNWGYDNSNLKNPHIISTSSDNNLLVFNSYFKTSVNATIMTDFIDGGIGYTNFVDPWLIDLSTPYGNSNRGFDAVSHQVDYSSNNLGLNSAYLGVFANHNEYFNPNDVSYLVKGPIVQTIHGVSTYFRKWKVISGQANFQNASSPETKVSFSQSNTIIAAEYKALQGSSNNSGIGNSGQRKILRSGDGCMHTVYESAGKIWYEKKEPGSSWVLVGDNDVAGAEAKSPSIAARGNSVVIIYQKKNGDNYDVVCQLFDSNGDGYSPNTIKINVALYSDDAQPVVACTNAGEVIFAWKQTSNSGNAGIHYSAGTVSVEGVYTVGRNGSNDLFEGKISESNSSSSSPSLASSIDDDALSGPGRWHFPLVWTQGSSIYYRDILYKATNGSWDLPPSYSNMLDSMRKCNAVC